MIEDAIDQQIQWSDIQEKEDWLTTVKNIVQSFINIRKTIPQAEEVGLTQEINQVINSLHKLKAFRDKDLQEEILEVKDRLEKLEQKINKKLPSENSRQKDSGASHFCTLAFLRGAKSFGLSLLWVMLLQENQLSSLKKLNSHYFNSFNQKSKNNTLENFKNNTLNKFKNQCDEQLKQLFRQALNLDDKDTQKIINLIKAGKKLSDEEWYEFLARILRASEKELEKRSCPKKGHHQSLSDSKEKEIENQLIELKEKIKSVSDHVFNSIRSKYNPVFGTLDPALTMWTARALAKESLAEFESDDDKADYLADYFHNLYRVSHEKLDKDVPSSVRFHLLRKSLLVCRDILVSWRGEKIRKNPLFSLFNFVLSIWQLWLAKLIILVITIIVTIILLLWL